MTTVPERMVVSATVKSRAEEADGFKLELDIPRFRSRYPTLVSRVPEAIAKNLAPREEPYRIVLLRENLKKDKDGRYPYDYYWGLEGLASAQEQADQAGEPDPLEEREHRIMRSTALAQAVAFIGLLPDKPTAVQVFVLAGAFYAWLRDGPQEAREEAPAPAVPVASPTSAKAPVAKGEAAGGEPLFPEEPEWPVVAPEHRETPISAEDWERVRAIREARGVTRVALDKRLRERWGLQYGMRARRKDLGEIVAWLQEQPKDQAGSGD